MKDTSLVLRTIAWSVLGLCCAFPPARGVAADADTRFFLEVLDSPTLPLRCVDKVRIGIRVAHFRRNLCGLFLGVTVVVEKGGVIKEVNPGELGFDFQFAPIWARARTELSWGGDRGPNVYYVLISCFETPSQPASLDTEIGTAYLWTPDSFEGSFGLAFKDPVLLDPTLRPHAAFADGRPSDENVLLENHPLLPVRCPHFLRGDVNEDGRINISDPIATLHFLFLGVDGIRCKKSGDIDDNGLVEITDAIDLLTYLFAGGPAPPPPFPEPGLDPTPDQLSCVGFYPPALRRPGQ
jgi:hypothetical protein